LPLILKPLLDAEASVFLVISLKYQGFKFIVNVALTDYADIKEQGLDKYFFKPEKEKGSAK